LRVRKRFLITGACRKSGNPFLGFENGN